MKTKTKNKNTSSTSKLIRLRDLKPFTLFTTNEGKAIFVKLLTKLDVAFEPNAIDLELKREMYVPEERMVEELTLERI